MDCKGTTGARFEHLWPQSWQSAIKMLEDQGYQDAVDYFVCLSNSHPCTYDTFSGLKSTCRLCKSPVSSCIRYSYMPLQQKIRQWCSSPRFCNKMTAHWREKDHWLNNAGGMLLRKNCGMEVVLLSCHGFGIPNLNGHYQLLAHFVGR